MFPFNLASFDDREEDVDFLRELVASVFQPEKIESYKRVVHLIGVSNIGKTTLLQRYEHFLINEIQNSCPVFISLNQYVDLPVGDFKETILASFESQIANYLGIQPADKNNLDADDVQHNIEMLQKNKAVVFLIDEASMLIDNKDLAMVLEGFLESWFEFPKTIFILTGRFVVKNWANFTLRPVTGINVRNLSGFNYENTELQIVRENPNAKHLADQIFEISGGSPGINKNILDQATGNPLEIVELDAIRACNRKLYEAIGKVGTDLPANLTAELLPALEALCVLQDFDKDYEAPLLFAAHKNLSGIWDVKRSASLLSILSNVQIGPGKLTDWDDRKSAYAIEEQTRTTLEREIQVRDKELWRTLHCVAMKMYAGWADKYDSDIFRNKAAYHRAKLEHAGFDLADCETKD